MLTSHFFFHRPAQYFSKFIVFESIFISEQKRKLHELYDAMKKFRETKLSFSL